jgi:hypothetical protein
MPTLPAEFKDWATLLNWLITGLLAVAVWLRKPGEDAGQAVSTLRYEIIDELAHMSHRLTVVEEQAKHVPSRTDVAELEGSIKAISMQGAGLAEAISTMRVQLNRIEAYLLRAQDSRL